MTKYSTEQISLYYLTTNLKGMDIDTFQVQWSYNLSSNEQFTGNWWLALIIKLTQLRIAWENTPNEGLFILDWPVGSLWEMGLITLIDVHCGQHYSLSMESWTV